MTGCLTNRVVVCKSLLRIIVTNRIGVGADYLFSILLEDLLPSFYAVVSDTFSTVVSIKAHPWDEDCIELVVGCLISAVFCDKEERARAEA